MKRKLLTFIAAVLMPWPAFAFQNVSIASVNAVSLQGPIHHGLAVQVTPIDDANLTAYEVLLKPDSPNPFPPYAVYNAQVSPYDSPVINLPYRSGSFAMVANQPYCVRIRAIYGSTATNWAQQCGITLPTPVAPSGDRDGDGISDADEFARGMDPQNTDSDGDLGLDGEELADGSDPNRPEFPDLLVRNGPLDFGIGDVRGSRANQHQYLEIENVGTRPARLQEVRSAQGDPANSETAFKPGAVPRLLSHLPPNNVLKLPISFIPNRPGRVTAKLEVLSNDPQPPTSVGAVGIGGGFPNCQITPGELNFGEVAQDDQAVLTREFTLNNIADPATPAGTQTPVGFTIDSSVAEMAPGIRAISLAPGERIAIPVLFRHSTPGEFEGELTVRSLECGDQSIGLKGTVR